MGLLRYRKETEDGIEEGPTLLGDIVGWLQILFWIIVALLFWVLCMPLLYPYTRYQIWKEEKDERLSR